MKKISFFLLCVIIVTVARAQEAPKRWEVKLGYEQPVFLKTAEINCETFRPSPRGVSVRGLYEVWKNRLSVGVALGYNESNYVCEDYLTAQVDSAGFIYISWTGFILATCTRGFMPMPWCGSTLSTTKAFCCPSLPAEDTSMLIICRRTSPLLVRLGKTCTKEQH